MKNTSSGKIPSAEGLSPSRRIPAVEWLQVEEIPSAEWGSRSSQSGGNSINGTSILEGLQWLGDKILFYSILEWNYEIGIQEVEGIGVLPCLLKM